MQPMAFAIDIDTCFIGMRHISLSQSVFGNLLKPLQPQIRLPIKIDQ